MSAARDSVGSSARVSVRVSVSVSVRRRDLRAVAFVALSNGYLQSQALRVPTSNEVVFNLTVMEANYTDSIHLTGSNRTSRSVYGSLSTHGTDS